MTYIDINGCSSKKVITVKSSKSLAKAVKVVCSTTLGKSAKYHQHLGRSLLNVKDIFSNLHEWFLFIFNQLKNGFVHYSFVS